MGEEELKEELAGARETIGMLQHELMETNRGLIALTVELEQRREEVIDLSAQLWQSAKLAAVGEMAASIAHELNNPMQIMSLRVEALQSQLAPDHPWADALGTLERELERMGKLVSNLLGFSRQRGPEIACLDPRKEIDHVLELIDFHLRRRKIEVVKNFAADTPRLLADREQFMQLLVNLATNAADAMPKGGTLTLRLRGEEDGADGERGDAQGPVPRPDSPPPGPRVVIQIEDTGVGIPTEDLGKIMAPFFTTKPEGLGTGLGLTICQRIVKEHRGSLAISSQVGRGTMVCVALPGVAGRGAPGVEGDE